MAIKIPGSDPIHKVTIVPRGRALGLTASLPEVDRHNYSKDWLIGSLAMFFGGRVAEELVFGADKITTGAGNDIERATGLARRMVTQFGMSELIGPLAVGDKEQEIFLGREFAQRREISERTAQMVDDEVKRLIDEAYARASTILSANRELLDRIAQALLDRETIDREDLDRLVKNQPLPPRTLPPAEPSAAPTGPAAKPGARPCPRPDPRSATGRTSRRVNVTPLALHSPRAVRDALRSHGWEETLADTAAEGIHTSAFHLTGLDQGALEALVPFAGGLGLEVLTGDNWAILAGSRSRLSALARPWTVPDPLSAGRGRHRDGPAAIAPTLLADRPRVASFSTGRSSLGSSTSRPTASATGAASPASRRPSPTPRSCSRAGADHPRRRRRVHPPGPHRGGTGRGGAAPSRAGDRGARARAIPDADRLHRHREGHGGARRNRCRGRGGERCLRLPARSRTWRPRWRLRGPASS